MKEEEFRREFMRLLGQIARSKGLPKPITLADVERERCRQKAALESHVRGETQNGKRKERAGRPGDK